MAILHVDIHVLCTTQIVYRRTNIPGTHIVGRYNVIASRAIDGIRQRGEAACIYLSDIRAPHSGAVNSNNAVVVIYE